jgi:hypothetical protein
MGNNNLMVGTIKKIHKLGVKISTISTNINFFVKHQL